MVLALIHNFETAEILLLSASGLATQLQKTFGILFFADTDELVVEKEKEFALSNIQVTVRNSNTATLADICDELDASFLFVQLIGSKNTTMRNLLSKCRDLRIPYLLFKDTFPALNLSRVVLPVGFLEEELEKAQFASAFGRFCNSEIIILTANDYGSKARVNTEKMLLLFEKFQFKYRQQKAYKDSFKVEHESIELALSEQAGLIIISASRDYGLDDLIFGPKEFHVLKKSNIPVLMVNPRGDLYALCD